MPSRIRISHVYFALATLSAWRIGIVIFALAALGACGGGGTGGTGAADSGGMGGTGVSTGVMTKGSVIVNGVRYDDSTANIVIDDTPKTAFSLQDGMVVSVSGSVDASGKNGTAQEVRGQIEVRGLVTDVFASVNPQRFVVFGQTVLVDDLTVYSNITFGGITKDVTIVEVYGLRDSAGNIRATRVEGSLATMPDGSGMSNPLVDEIRGVVSTGFGTNPVTFKLGNQEVAVVPGATIVGGNYANGSVVEVHCTRSPACLDSNDVFQASLIEVEDGNNLPGQGQRFEVEGLISGFTAHPGSFQVAGVSVTTSGSTIFKGGIAGDLLNDIKVEAEGTWNGSVLVANKIEFKRSVVRLQGIVLALPAPTTNAFTLQIGGPLAARNVLIETDMFTQGAIPSSGPNCVEVRGQRKNSAGIVVTAGEIDTGCSHGGDHVLQALVEAKAEPNLTLLGFTVDVTNAQFRNLNDDPIGQSAFFGLVSAGTAGPPPVAGTLVRIRFDKNDLSVVSEVELED